MLTQITGTGYGRTGGSGRLVKNRIISGSGGSASGGFGNTGFSGKFSGRTVSRALGYARAQIKRPVSGSGGSASLNLGSFHKSRTLGADPVVYGADSFCLFFPPITINYVDQEPGAFVTSEAEIRGLVTGVEQLGSMLQMAFAGEPVDIRWYGATDGVDDWGDGFHVSPPNFVHTYTAAGIYAIKRTASDDVSAKAVRIMKVVERGNGSGTGGTITADQPIYLHPEPYGITIDPVIEGTIDGTFGMRFSLRTNGHAYPDELHVGRVEERCGLAVFAETYANGVKDPEIKLVAAGFVTERTLDLDPNTGNLSGIAYDPLYWLNLQSMRDQFYTNTSYLGLQGLQDTNQQLINSTLACSTPTPPLGQENTDDINIPALDLALLGYVPEHVLANCNPIFAAAHVLQHARVTVPYFTYPDDLQMYNLPTPSDYGNLGQFTNITVPPGFDELEALGGYHGFPVPQGYVLANIRTLLQNMGAAFHSRSDLTLVFDYKPFYKPQLPPAVYVLDVPRSISPVKVGGGTPIPIFRVQVQKPLLGFTSTNLSLPNNGQYPLNPATGEPASLSDLGTLLASNAYQHGLLGISASEWSAWYRQVAQPLYAAAGSPQTMDLNNWDYYNDSLDQRNFIWEVQVGEPGGLILGPIQNVFADDLQTFAVGIAKERAAHWQLNLPLGNAYHLNLGQVVYLNYTNTGMQLSWSLKPFWVISLRQILNSDRYTRQITLLEISPDEVVVHAP